jgi:hypothetical protein
MVEEHLLKGGKYKSKFKLGKLTNKYLIIDLYAFAYSFRDELI